MDKVQLIREQIILTLSNLDTAEKECFITEHGRGGKEYLEGILDFIDSLPEEPVSEDLKED